MKRISYSQDTLPLRRGNEADPIFPDYIAAETRQ